MSQWHVALLYNIMHAALADPDAPEEWTALYAAPQTVDLVAQALSAAGHTVTPMEADLRLPEMLHRTAPDICFNMAVGLTGADRHAQVPALLEMSNLPYTGSGVLAHALAMDRVRSRRLWQAYGLPVAPFHLATQPDDLAAIPAHAFPLLAQPAKLGNDEHEGILVDDPIAGRAALETLWAARRGPVLLDPIAPGPTYVVGILGNPPLPSARTSTNKAGATGRTSLPIELPILELEPWTGRSMAETREHTGMRPARLESTVRTALHDLAVCAFHALEVRDVACVHCRLDADGCPQLLHLTTLPILDPTDGFLPAMARAIDLSPATLIQEILVVALERYHLTAHAFQ